MATTIYVFDVRDSGALQSGLTPTWSTLRKLSDGTAVASPGTVAPIVELGGGLYKATYDSEGVNGELAGVIDAGAGITAAADRYIPMTLAQDSSRVARLDATITSRSNHSAADAATAVWASGTRTLTSFGTLVADVATAVWAAGTRTLSSFGTLVTSVWAAGTRTLTALPDPAPAGYGSSATILSGESTLTAIDGGSDGQVGLFVGDAYSLILRVLVGGNPPGVTGATWTFSTTDEATGAAISSDVEATLLSEDIGYMSYALQAGDTASARRVRLTAKRELGSDIRIFGPLILNVRDR